jgi:hypothetical protein
VLNSDSGLVQLYIDLLIPRMTVLKSLLLFYFSIYLPMAAYVIEPLLALVDLFLDYDLTLT